MVKSTAWGGEFLRAGEDTDVDSVVAKRWVNNGIARYAEPKALEDMTHAELRKMAASQGIATNGLKKAEIIELLQTPTENDDEEKDDDQGTGDEGGKGDD